MTTANTSDAEHTVNPAGSSRVRGTKGRNGLPFGTLADPSESDTERAENAAENRPGLLGQRRSASGSVTFRRERLLPSA